MNTQLFGSADAPNLFIVGPSGAGKHLFASQRLVNSLAEGKSAVVFDCGRSYAGIAKSLGGTLATVFNDGLHVERFGSLPLTVYEMESVRNPVALAKLGVPEPSEALFVLVDEAWQVSRRCPDLLDWLQKASAAGASFCGVMQSMADFDTHALPASTQILKVKDHTLVGATPAQA